jgi:23S rRNA (guanosine2251-2'-O)-methyltransferase
MRVADGVGATHLHLCGITPTPEHPKLAKTALGAEKAVRWTYYGNALVAASALATDGVLLWALENMPGTPSVLGCALPERDAGVALIVGNEVTGVDPELLALCERILHLPMHGLKSSLNVAVAFGVAAYWLRGNARPAAWRK